MPPRNPDLHGNAPDSLRVALVLVDVINDPTSRVGTGLPHALAMAERLAALVAHARRAHVPVIYVNDNFGRSRSDFRTLLERCLRPPVRGRPLARRLRPRANDDVVLKAKHSGFYATTLELLRRYLGTITLIVTGLTGDRCVLFTASDVVHNRRALGEMARLLNADLMGARHLALSRSGVRHLGSGVRRLGSGVRRLDSAAAARPRSARAPAAWTPRRPPAPAA